MYEQVLYIFAYIKTVNEEHKNLFHVRNADIKITRKCDEKMYWNEESWML